MKLRIKLFLITLLAMLAFVGIGFASWTFTNIENASVDSFEDKVAVDIELNDGFKLYNAADDQEVTELYLICDAPTVATSDYLAGQGVYWSTSATGKDGSGNKLAITNVYIKGTMAKADEDNVWDKTTVDVAFTADYSALNSTYVTFGSAPIIANTTGIAVANNAVVQSASFALPSVTYTDLATGIASIEELTAMDTALASDLSSAVLSFTAQIVA